MPFFSWQYQITRYGKQIQLWVWWRTQGQCSTSLNLWNSQRCKQDILKKKRADRKDTMICLSDGFLCLIFSSCCICFASRFLALWVSFRSVCGWKEVSKEWPTLGDIFSCLYSRWQLFKWEQKMLVCVLIYEENRRRDTIQEHLYSQHNRQCL